MIFIFKKMLVAYFEGIVRAAVCSGRKRKFMQPARVDGSLTLLYTSGEGEIAIVLYDVEKKAGSAAPWHKTTDKVNQLASQCDSTVGVHKDSVTHKFDFINEFTDYFFKTETASKPKEKKEKIVGNITRCSTCGIIILNINLNDVAKMENDLDKTSFIDPYKVGHCIVKDGIYQVGDVGLGRYVVTLIGKHDHTAHHKWQG